MSRLSTTLGKTLASAVVTAAALGGCSMMCRACGSRKCGATASASKCGGCKAGCAAKKCGACGAKK